MRHGSYRLLAVLGVTLALLLLATACGAAEAPTPAPTKAPTTVVASPTPVPPTPTPAPPEAKYGGIAIFAHRNDPQGWDTMRTSGSDLQDPMMLMYGTGSLTRECRDNQFETCPYLAESWEPNADFTAWTFKIRDNVFWHDGTPFTAEDARWGLDFALKGVKGRAPARFAGTMGPIEKMEVQPGNRLRITLASPMGAFPTIFAQNDTAQLEFPKHLTEPELNKGNVNLAPNEVNWVGMGAYKMLKYDKGAVIQYRKFDRYWEKDAKGRAMPYIDGIDAPIMKEQSTMVAAFRAGRLDRTSPYAGRYITAEQEKIIKAEMGDKVVVYRYPTFGKLIGINASKAPYNDVRVRQALSLWIDRQSYMDAIESGYGQISAVWFAKSPLANPDVLTWPGWNTKTKEADKKKAKELLASAGYPNGFKVTILTGQSWINYAEWLKGQLDPLMGTANVNIAIFDSATYNKKICDGDFDLIQPLSSGVQARHSPEAIAGGYVSTNKCSYIRHDDKKVDELFARIQAIGDQAERVKLAREIERYLSIESWLALNIGEDGANFVAFRNYVKGWNPPQVTPYSNADYVTVWLDK
ncbi:MAG: ABC transporter substrate-binding protein [Chloroflexi bacterium]|nr:ABC transporter substrate-binding protein [Chloroflexota bacterium]